MALVPRDDGGGLQLALAPGGGVAPEEAQRRHEEVRAHARKSRAPPQAALPRARARASSRAPLAARPPPPPLTARPPARFTRRPRRST